MDKRIITTSLLFRLAQRVLPESVLLHLFGRRITVAATRRRVR
jgi:hypothetical protein